MEPWMDLSNAKEQYGLVYESNYLAELGRTLDSFNDKIVSIVASGALKLTVLEGKDNFSFIFAITIRWIGSESLVLRAHHLLFFEYIPEIILKSKAKLFFLQNTMLKRFLFMFLF